MERIHARFQRNSLLSEESKDDLATAGQLHTFWIVNPLDGTKEFIARNGEFSIMIGLVVEGRAVLGVVQQPATSLLYASAAAWLISTKMANASD